jgi:YidC/Oxa1 family membrane protein insertase
MTPFAEAGMTLRKVSASVGALLPPRRRSLVLLLAIVALLVVACAPAGGAGSSGGPVASPTAQLPLTPAPLHADPFSLLAWLYTPLFQGLFIILMAIKQVTPDIGIAIVVMTLVVRTLMIPLMRRQMVSMRRMQAIAPEMKEIQKRYKTDRVKQQAAISALYKERGVSQAGCLTSLLPMLILLPMYTVIRDGLQSFDPTPMLNVFGIQLINLSCTGTGIPDAHGYIKPCLDTVVPWLGNMDVSQPSTFPVLGFGVSILAIVYTLFQLFASRMALPPHDPNTPADSNTRAQRQTMLFLPLISILYGGIIPVGLYLYLIVTTIYQVIQQFLTTGWGGMFPLFGWMPAFAVDHKPRFPVAAPAPMPTTREAGAPARSTPPRSTPVDRAASAASTVRPSQRGRQGRRGRRR